MTFAVRVTDPDSNHHLTISELISTLDTLRQEHGDMRCYIYSTDRKALVPLLPLSVPSGKKLDIRESVDIFC